MMRNGEIRLNYLLLHIFGHETRWGEWMCRTVHRINKVCCWLLGHGHDVFNCVCVDKVLVGFESHQRFLISLGDRWPFLVVVGIFEGLLLWELRFLLVPLDEFFWLLEFHFCRAHCLALCLVCLCFYFDSATKPWGVPEGENDKWIQSYIFSN